MEIMGYLENRTAPGQMAAAFQPRIPTQLDARADAAGWARRHWPSNSDSPFRPPPNYAVLSSVLAALLFAASGAAQAATINAASPSLVDVTTAIASAVDGDTVIIPAGTASWMAGLVITKGITLKGQTTTDPVAKTANDQTIILDDVVRGPGGTPIIWVQGDAGKTYRVSGITFQRGSVTDVNFNGGILLRGNLSGSSNSHAVRVDHCHFDDLYQNVYVEAADAIYGVIDHNLFDFHSSNNSNESVFVAMQNWGGPNQYGDGSWTEPAYFGSEKFVFIEDNCINNTSGNEFAGAIDDRQGGRWVLRYNHLYDVVPGSHGTEIGRYRGGRCREVYNNDYHWTIARNAGGMRSGGYITHDNTHDGVQPQSGPDVGQYRVFFPVPVWGGSTGDNPWDYNVTEADGTHIDGHSPYLFDSGTAGAGSNQTTIVDTTKTWTINQWAGYTAKRISDNGMMIILSNTSNTLTGYYHTGYGGGTTWVAGDQYQIHRVLISQDQACRGAGDLITGDTPINSTTGTASWSHQALEPAYMWNDVYNPGNVPVTMHTNSLTGVSTILTEGRDYFNNTPMPGYTPYTYPHPLVSGEGPEAPQGLHIMP